MLDRTKSASASTSTMYFYYVFVSCVQIHQENTDKFYPGLALLHMKKGKSGEKCTDIGKPLYSVAHIGSGDLIINLIRKQSQIYI